MEMAKYQVDRFADAAKAYFTEYGLVPVPAEADEKVFDTRENARKLAAKLGEKHAAYAGLMSIGTLRDSIARRFIRLSVAPLAPRPRKTSEKAAASANGKGKSAKAATPAKRPARTEAPATEAPAAAATA